MSLGTGPLGRTSLGGGGENNTPVKVSRVHGEVLLQPEPSVRVSRVHGEVLIQPVPSVRVSRAHVEVLYNPTPTDSNISGEWILTG